MNVFSEKAHSELKLFGLRPFPILHMSEISKQQPMKPVKLMLNMDGDMQSDEKLFILSGDKYGFKNETDIPLHKIGNNFVCVELNHFCM